jgi:3-oxoacyl-[acyl-carrier-protein] synthase II
VTQQSSPRVAPGVVVTGIGLISALGDLSQTWQRLLLGQSGIIVQQPFEGLGPQPLAMLGPQPASLTALTQTLVQAALADAGLTSPLPDCAVVVGSSRGQQSQWEQLLGQCQSQTAGLCSAIHPPSLPWLETLPHAAAIAAAQQVSTHAAVRSPTAACATGLWAIAQGYTLIASGEYDCVIAGAVETPITPLTLAGFEQMGALAKTGAYPFDLHREGLVLGEGGALLVLESAVAVARRQAPSYGKLLGFGLSADGFHVSAPHLQGDAAIAAITHCLDRSGLSPSKIDYIHAHGTATPLNDANEAGLIQRLFPDGVAVSSTKGATGHTIGASGALGLALCFMALRHQQLPPTVGLTRPAFNLDLVVQARPALVRHALCLGFGFGGQNAAIAVSV